MRKFILCVLLAVSLTGCQDNEPKEKQNLTASELLKSEAFNYIANEYLDIFIASNFYTINFSDEERFNYRKKIEHISFKGKLEEEDKELLRKVLELKSIKELDQRLDTFEDNVKQLNLDYPKLFEPANSNIIQEAFNQIVTTRNAKVNGKNCRGIYNACLNVVLAGGALCIYGTAGIGSYLCVMGAYAGNELCLQEYKGCIEEEQEAPKN